MDLFTFGFEQEREKFAPLAQRMRPRNLGEYIGQNHIVGEGKYLNRLIQAGHLPSLLFYGPPGTGKTTLAKIMAEESGKNFIELSAVTSNVKEVKKVLEESVELLAMERKASVLFLDEIHRFNKSQQDVLLPYMERGEITLIGATTENPYFYMNNALLSRMQVLEIKSLTEENVKTLLYRALEDEERGFGRKNVTLTDGAVSSITYYAKGDGRALLNTLEIAVLSTPEVNGEIHIDKEILENSMVKPKVQYDRDGNQHYDTISAFIKSMRGSDPDAAIFYLAKMLEGGEEPEFIARRLIIFASEDVGNADPHALDLAVSCFEGLRIIGMPEGRILLAHATSYLASAPKSNSAYMALNRAMSDVKGGVGDEIPLYLRDKHQPLEEGESYQYPHDYPGNYVKQRYFPLDMTEKNYYTPTNNGYEKKIHDYLQSLEKDEDGYGY